MCFSWRACRDFSTKHACVNSVTWPFMAATRTTTLLVANDERGIIYLAATNAEWLPSLANKGIQYVYYSAHIARRQFGLKQDIPNDFTLVWDTTTSVCPFLCPSAFKFWSKLFTVVTIPSF